MIQWRQINKILLRSLDFSAFPSRAFLPELWNSFGHRVRKWRSDGKHSCLKYGHGRTFGRLLVSIFHPSFLPTLSEIFESGLTHIFTLFWLLNKCTVNHFIPDVAFTRQKKIHDNLSKTFINYGHKWVLMLWNWLTFNAGQRVNLTIECESIWLVKVSQFD